MYTKPNTSEEYLANRAHQTAICCAEIASAHKSKGRARCPLTKQAAALRIYRAECALSSLYPEN